MADGYIPWGKDVKGEQAEQENVRAVYQFARSAITKQHGLGGLNSRDFFFYSSAV